MQDRCMMLTTIPGIALMKYRLYMPLPLSACSTVCCKPMVIRCCSWRHNTVRHIMFCMPAVHLTGRRHLRSATSDKLGLQQPATAIGRRNFAVSGPETWNSLPAELRLSTLSTATFARRLKARLFVSTEWHVPAARLILLKTALLINIIIIIIIIIVHHFNSAQWYKQFLQISGLYHALILLD